MKPGFWKDKRVLVTGHTGFKGGWLCLWLQQLGATVVGYSLDPPSKPSLFEQGKVSQGMTSLHGDVRDLPKLVATMYEHQPEIVIHMAAQSLVRYSYHNPVETYATNVMGTVNVLEAVRQAGGTRAVLIVTSDKCYENRGRTQGYREDEPMGGYDPYSSSKGCAELVTTAYRNSYFNEKDATRHGAAIASARAGNVIGGGDWATDRLIPDFLRAADAGETLKIRSPHAIRPWQHVLEPLCGYLMLAECLYLEGDKAAEPWNFGPVDEDVRPVRWIMERLAALRSDVNWECDSAVQPHEAHYLKLDSSKACVRLGWRPRWQLGTALTKTIEWHEAWRRGKDMRAFTLAQIAGYQSSQRDG